MGRREIKEMHGDKSWWQERHSFGGYHSTQSHISCLISSFSFPHFPFSFLLSIYFPHLSLPPHPLFSAPSAFSLFSLFSLHISASVIFVTCFTLFSLSAQLFSLLSAAEFNSTKSPPRETSRSRPSPTFKETHKQSQGQKSREANEKEEE